MDVSGGPSRPSGWGRGWSWALKEETGDHCWQEGRRRWAQAEGMARSLARAGNPSPSSFPPKRCSLMCFLKRSNNYALETISNASLALTRYARVGGAFCSVLMPSSPEGAPPSWIQPAARSWGGVSSAEEQLPFMEILCKSLKAPLVP